MFEVFDYRKTKDIVPDVRHETPLRFQNTFTANVLPLDSPPDAVGRCPTNVDDLVHQQQHF